MVLVTSVPSGVYAGKQVGSTGVEIGKINGSQYRCGYTVYDGFRWTVNIKTGQIWFNLEMKESDVTFMINPVTVYWKVRVNCIRGKKQ